MRTDFVGYLAVALILVFTFACTREPEKQEESIIGDVVRETAIKDPLAIQKIKLLSEDPKIGVRNGQDHNLREYHVTIEISQFLHEEFSRQLHTEQQDKKLEKIGEFGAQVIVDLMNIEGVVKVEIEPYKIMVEKAPLFDWSKVESRIVEVIKKAAEPKENNEWAISN